MPTEKPTPMERLERLEVWAIRSFLVMTSCAVLLALMLGHMAYVQISSLNYRAQIDARNIKLDRETEEQKKVFADADAKIEERQAKNREEQAALLKKHQAIQNGEFSPDLRKGGEAKKDGNEEP